MALSSPLMRVSCSPTPAAAATTRSNNNNQNNNFLCSHALDAVHIRRAAELADKSAGFTSPHPNFGCVIATQSGKVAGEGFLYAQGTRPAEVLAAEAAGNFSRRGTAYLNMEPGDCHGDHAAVSALVQVAFFSFSSFISFSVPPSLVKEKKNIVIILVGLMRWKVD